MDNLLLALIFYIAGAVIRTVYGFLAKIATMPSGELAFDVKYFATMIMSIIVSLIGAIGTFALVIPAGINLVAVFRIAFPSGYVLFGFHQIQWAKWTYGQVNTTYLVQGIASMKMKTKRF